MKELSIEEKAKRYDEAIIKAKITLGCCNSASVITKHTIYDVFPELKETEDELTWLKRFIKEEIDCLSFDIRNSEDCVKLKNLQRSIAWLEKKGENSVCKVKIGETYKCIASPRYTCFCEGDIYHVKDNFVAELINTCSGCFVLLEKQDSQILADSAKTCKDEQKPTDKVKPKFKVGDWIVNHNIVYHIDKISGVYLTLSTLDGTALVYHISVFDSEYTHLWNIEDAKDGDVLAWDDNKCIAIFKDIYDEESFESHGCVGHLTGVFEPKQFYHDIEDAHPATKEQRDTLIKAMADAGWEFDSKKKELNWTLSKKENTECNLHQ